jgi:hypothetical protein
MGLRGYLRQMRDATDLMILGQLSQAMAHNHAVLKSLLRCPFSWLTFYVETAAIAGVCLAAAALVADRGWNPLAVLTPLVVAALFLYARLLGRLGWRLAETMG